MITAGICGRRNGVPGQFARQQSLTHSCPLWVKSGHKGRFNQCPLYPQKRTSKLAPLSATTQQLRQLRDIRGYPPLGPADPFCNRLTTAALPTGAWTLTPCARVALSVACPCSSGSSNTPRCKLLSAMGARRCSTFRGKLTFWKSLRLYPHADEDNRGR
jgi:hypothetical protein